MEIKTDALFKKEIKKCIEYALQEFGLKTARKWQTQYKEIKRLLEFMPKRYPIVAHFRNETMEFRGATIMKNFKIIYFYNEEKDIMINKRTRQVSQRILNSVGHLAGCLFGVVFYKDSSTSFQSINPLPVSSSSTARAITLRLSALNGSV